MALELKKAERKKVKLRLGISSPSGGGKTYSALLLAYGITQDWSKIAVIDSENESASLYSHLGEFSIVNLEAPYTPELYIEAIKLCENNGMEAIILDSASHEWSGSGGCLEINEHIAQTKFRGNTWSAWSHTTPRHENFLQTMLQSKCHIISCSRSKTETIQTEDKKIKKIGMKDIQRDGFEYELTIAFNLDRDTHTAIASKDRTNLFEGKDPFIITPETGKLIKEWCEKGIDPEKQKKIEYENALEKAIDEMFACDTINQMKEIWAKHKIFTTNERFITTKDNKKELLTQNNQE